MLSGGASVMGNAYKGPNYVHKRVSSCQQKDMLYYVPISVASVLGKGLIDG